MKKETSITDKTKAINYDLLLCADFLLSKGFHSAERWFDKRWGQFRVRYEIDGYDCIILVSPSPQTVGEMTPGYQVDNFSEIKKLKKHHIGDWQIFINSTDNHLATFHYQKELIEFMKICDCALIGT